MAIAHYFCTVNGKNEMVVVDSTSLPFLTESTFSSYLELSNYIAEMRKQNASVLS